MAAATPFTLQGFLRYPPDDGEADADMPFSLQGTYKDEVKLTLNLSASGTKVLDFGTLTLLGAKAILIEVAPVSGGDTAAPVMIRVNGGIEDIEISQGGFLAFGSPNPAVGLLGLEIVHTQNACVKVRVLGS